MEALVSMAVGCQERKYGGGTKGDGRSVPSGSTKAQAISGVQKRRYKLQK